MTGIEVNTYDPLTGNYGNIRFRAKEIVINGGSVLTTRDITEDTDGTNSGAGAVSLIAEATRPEPFGTEKSVLQDVFSEGGSSDIGGTLETESLPDYFDERFAYFSDSFAFNSIGYNNVNTAVSHIEINEASIIAGALEISAASDADHYFMVATADEYADDISFELPSKETVTESFFGGLSGASLGAAVSFTESLASIHIGDAQSTTTVIDATDITISAQSIGTADAKPLSAKGAGVSFGDLLNKSKVEIENSSIQSLSDASVSTDANPGVAVSVSVSNISGVAIGVAYAQMDTESAVSIDSDTEIDVANDLFVQANTTSFKRVASQATGGAVGKLAAAYSFSNATTNTNLDLDGKVTVGGDAYLDARYENVPAHEQLFFSIIPTLEDGVAADATAGVNYSGNAFEAAQKNLAEKAIRTLWSAKARVFGKAASKLGNGDRGKGNRVAVASATSIDDHASSVNLGSESADLTIKGDLFVNSSLSARPNTGASADTAYEPRNLNGQNSNNRVEYAFGPGKDYAKPSNTWSVSAPVADFSGESAINYFGGLELVVGGEISSNSKAENKIEGLWIMPVINAFEEPTTYKFSDFEETYTSDAGSTMLTTGDRVLVADDHTEFSDFRSDDGTQLVEAGQRVQVVEGAFVDGDIGTIYLYQPTSDHGGVTFQLADIAYESDGDWLAVNTIGGVYTYAGQSGSSLDLSSEDYLGADWYIAEVALMPGDWVIKDDNYYENQRTIEGVSVNLYTEDYESALWEYKNFTILYTLRNLETYTLLKILSSPGIEKDDGTLGT